MASIIKQLSLQWDLWIEQYRAFFPAGQEDLESCRALLATTPAAGAPFLHGERTAACQDTRSGTLVACIQLTDATGLAADPALASDYNLAVFEERRLPQMAVFSSIAFTPDTPKNTVAPILLSHCFIEVLKAGGKTVLMSCDSEDFALYKRIGMRPVGPLRKGAGERQYLPMILLPDYDYLSIIHSPILPMLRGLDFSRYEGVCQWYYDLVRNNPELQIGTAFYPEGEETFEGHHAITEDLSEAGKAAFLKNALVIKCREGEVLLHENDGGKAFGFVRRGIVRVVIGGKTIVLLGEGDIFGEIAYILHSKRTAQVVAAGADTEVVLFSESAIKRLERESDRTILWRNLARVLAQRLMVTNKMLG